MSRRIQTGNEASQGSIVDQCNAVSSNASSIVAAAHKGITAVPYDSLQILQLQADQLSELLKRCLSAFPGSFADDGQTTHLSNGLESLQRMAAGLNRHFLASAKNGMMQRKRIQSKLWQIIRTKSGRVEDASTAVKRFEIAQVEFQAALDAIEYSRDRRYQPFYRWLPTCSSQENLHYWPPVAYETVTGYLLGGSLPQRMVIYGPSGSGKTTLVRQIQRAFQSPEHVLHDALSARFPEGIRWIDCGLNLSTKSPTFVQDLRLLTFALAINLLPDEEPKLKSMTMAELTDTIRNYIIDNAVLVIFENVWDAEMFRPSCLNISAVGRFGKPPKGAVLMTSQFNIASDLNWHSPETIVVPLAPNSNRDACFQLLTHLWMRDAKCTSFPVILEPLAKKFVSECGCSPLGLQVIAHILSGTSKQRKWQELLAQLAENTSSGTLRRRSATSLDEEKLPNLIYVYQLAASRLPPALQIVVSALALFPSARWVPLAALVFVYMQTTGRSLSESSTVIFAMSHAYFLDLEIPDGSFMSGMFSYHAILAQFVALSPDYHAAALPSKLSEETCLALSVAKAYALPIYQQQAAQVFSRASVGKGAVAWSHQTKPNFWTEQAWLLLLELSQHTTLAKAAVTIIGSACRESVCEAEVGPALSQLVGNTTSIFPTAAIYSDIVWQVEDEEFLFSLTEHLEKNQAVPRVVMQLRELLSGDSAEEQMANAQHVTVFAWALADLVQFSSINVAVKLRSEPMIERLKTYGQGAAVYAYMRLMELMGLPSKP